MTVEVNNNEECIISNKNLLEYDLHGKPLLALALSRNDQKYIVLNEKGEEIAFNAGRLFIYPQENNLRTAKELLDFASRINAKASNYDAESLWQLIKTEGLEESEISKIFELTKLENNLENFALIRRVLIVYNQYFKRTDKGFRIRTEDEVAKGKESNSAKLNAETDKLALQLALQKRISGGNKTNLPESIRHIEEIAALGKKAAQVKMFSELIESLVKKLNPPQEIKHIEQKAFFLLKSIGHFSDNHNLSPIRLGRPTQFNSEERNSAEKIFQNSKKLNLTNRLDLSELQTFTIDSDDTLDFDDAFSLVKDGETTYLWVHIADTSSYIEPENYLIQTIKRRATSIYCPDETIPMLPASLSEGVLSLKEGMRRAAISFKFRINELEIQAEDIFTSIIKVSKRYSYDTVDSILYDKPEHEHFSIFHALWDLASNRELRRMEAGALLFNRRELNPVVEKGKKIKLSLNSDDTPSRKIISELMIISNEFAASYAFKNNIPFVFRSQESPDIDIETASAHIPDGPAREFARRGLLKKSLVSTKANPHAGLGLRFYCQVTSPIRRAMDHFLIHQLRVYLQDKVITYSEESLSGLIEELQVGSDEANLIQRERNRYWLLKYIEQEKFKSFMGTIIRIDGARPLVELDDLYAIFPFNPLKENLVNRLGERINLKITKLDPQNERLYLSEDE